MTAQQPDLGDLDLLVLVARVGSIGRAAEERGLSQPSVSRRMTALERTLGVPLLARSRRGSTLTPTGRVVVGWAATLLGQAEDFERSVRSLRDTRSVAVRVAVSMTIAENLAPGWIARLHGSEPDLAVSLVVHNSTEVGDEVESGNVDLGFIESPTVRRSLRKRRIAWDALVVAVPPDHAWAGRRRGVPAAELAVARLLVREPGSGTRETLEHALAQRGLELAPGPVMGSNAALKSAAVAGMGPVVLSRLALAPELGSGRLVAVSTPDLVLRRPLTAIWRGDEQLSEGAASLLRVALDTPFV